MKQSKVRIGIAAALVLATAFSWWWTANPTVPQLYVLGLYRERYFLLNSALGYLSLCSLILALAPNGRDWLFRFVGISFGFIMALAVLELAAVLGVADYRLLLDRNTWHVDTQREMRRITHPNISWEGEGLFDLTPRLGVPSEPFPMSYRNDEYGLRNLPGKEDPQVFALGDSLLVGWPVDAEQIISERLQQLLGVTVLNVSEVGSCPQEQLRRLDATGLPLEDRLVLHFVFEGNDLKDSAAWYSWRNRTFPSDWPHSGILSWIMFRLKVPSRTTASDRFGWVSTGTGVREKVYFLYDGVQGAAMAEELGRMGADLAAGRRAIEERGGRYALVLIPQKLTVMHPFAEWPEGSVFADPARWESPLREDLGAVAMAEGIPFLDTTDALRGCFEGDELPFYPLDTHLAPCGHSAIAESVAPFARSLLE